MRRLNERRKALLAQANGDHSPSNELLVNEAQQRTDEAAAALIQLSDGGPLTLAQDYHAGIGGLRTGSGASPSDSTPLPYTYRRYVTTYGMLYHR